MVQKCIAYLTRANIHVSDKREAHRELISSHVDFEENICGEYIFSTEEDDAEEQNAQSSKLFRLSPFHKHFLHLSARQSNATGTRNNNLYNPDFLKLLLNK